MDLKTALKDILPHVVLKAPRKMGDKWPIDRPIEYHVCECGQTVDQRILDICIYTCSDDTAIDNHRQWGHWCKIHDAPEIIALCIKSKPCNRCYRWFIPKMKRMTKVKKVIDKETGEETVTKTKVWVEEPICWTCRHNPWCTMPVPGIARRSWFIAPKEHVELEVEDEV